MGLLYVELYMIVLGNHNMRLGNMRLGDMVESFCNVLLVVWTLEVVGFILCKLGVTGSL